MPPICHLIALCPWNHRTRRPIRRDINSIAWCVVVKNPYDDASLNVRHEMSLRYSVLWRGFTSILEQHYTFQQTASTSIVTGVRLGVARSRSAKHSPLGRNFAFKREMRR